MAATTNGSEKPGVDPSIALSHPLSQVSAEDLPVEALPAADLTPSSPSPCSHARVIVVKASSASSLTPSPSPLEVALGNLDRAIKAKDFSSDFPIIAVSSQLAFETVPPEIRLAVHNARHCLHDIVTAFSRLRDLDPTALEPLDAALERLQTLAQQICTNDCPGKKKEFRPERLSEVVASAVSSFDLIEKSGIEFVCEPLDPLSHLVTDREGQAYVTQEALYNLVQNALRYTKLYRQTEPLKGEATGRVCLKTAVSRTTGGWIARFDVEDNGPGMSLEDQARLFQEGFRAQSTSSMAGSGIGLNGSRDAVQSLGGEMGATSKGPGKGSISWFTMPCVKGTLTIHPSMGEKVKISKALARILIVEDMSSLRRSLVRMCINFGFKILDEATGFKILDQATTEDEAVSLCEQKKYDLIFMDNGLNPGSGIEATKRIRQLPLGKSPVIFAFTGDVDEESQEAFTACGMNACLSKPIDQFKLVGLLGRFFDFTLEPA